MHKLYLDTCILNDTFPLMQRERGGGVRDQDIKTPLSRWAAEYVALYHLLDLDDQWELEFGTSQATLDEIAKFRAVETRACEKKSCLENMSGALYKNYLEKCHVESGPIAPDLFQRTRTLLDENDSRQICQAIQGRWEFFITTDFRTILVHQSALEQLAYRALGYQGRLWPPGAWEPLTEELGIKARSPLQFLEQHLLPLPTLIRTLYGSWTDPDEFVLQTGRALRALSLHGS